MRDLTQFVFLAPTADGRRVAEGTAQVAAVLRQMDGTASELTDILNARGGSFDADEIISGGPPPDGIRPIDAPCFDDVATADTWLADESPVMVVEVDDDRRAYPLAIIRVFSRWGVPMPSYKMLKAAVGGLARTYIDYHGPYSMAPVHQPHVPPAVCCPMHDLQSQALVNSMNG